MLPIELWTQVFGYLKPREHRALAAASSWFFTVVHNQEPFRLVVTENVSIEDLLSNAPIFREWSTQFYWAPLMLVDLGEDEEPPTVYRRGVLPSIHATLLHLATFPRLTSIELVRVTVDPEGQRTIYSLPHLRSITLRLSQFQYTPVSMPNHGVTHLRIFNIGNPAAFTHILRQVAGSLTTLEVCSKDGGPVLSDLVRCPLLRSIALELGGPLPFPRTILQFLELHPEITDLKLDCHLFPVIPPSLLPNLRRLESTTATPSSLLESRPIESFLHLRTYGPWDLTIWSELASFKKAPRRNAVRELRVAFHQDFCALYLISDTVGRTLQRLHVWVTRNTALLTDPADSYGFLLGQWSTVRTQSEATVAFPMVKEVLISFQRDDGCSFPLKECQMIFYQVLLPLCPVLEEAELFAISSYDRIEREDPQVGWWVRYWKDGSGQWNCRNDGAY
jgi:hypothetical protein